MICYSSYSQSISNLNSIFSTYSHTIKTNSPFSECSTSCIYNANYMNAEQRGNILILNFGYGWDKQYGYIHKCTLRINLSTATFCTGWWDNWGGRWKQYGKKEEITIKDSNGMDLTSVGQQHYNQGTKQDLISELKISFGSEPLANRVLNELYAIQSSYKTKEPWLLPEPQPINQGSSSASEATTPRSTTPRSTTPRSTTPSNTPTKKNNPTKKVGRYVQ